MIFKKSETCFSCWYLENRISSVKIQFIPTTLRVWALFLLQYSPAV